MKKLTLSSMLIILALSLSYLERFIPINVLVGVPGIRLGLANVVSLFALYYINLSTAVAILVLRCFLSAVLFGVFTSFLFSVTGGIYSILVMYFLIKYCSSRVSLFGISVAGAAAHNIGQILIAMLGLQSINLLSYLPFLLMLSIPTGLMIGFLASITFDRLEKTKLVASALK